MKLIDYKDFDVLRIGNEIEIKGVLYGCDDYDNILILLPDEDIDTVSLDILAPDLPQWEQIIRQSDIKEILAGEKGKKIVLRKSTRQIETRVSWEVFRRDNYTCRYCNTDNRPLTVDHIVLWENLGPSIPLNLLTTCKKCNSTRGSMEYEDWIKSISYIDISDSLPDSIFSKNLEVLNDIPEIKANHLRNMKRSR